ncbi:uncharacterized protein LOC144153467 [Haemaphysalis longicornis]
MAGSIAQSGLRVWHWNANGFQCRRAILQQHLKTVDRTPDVIMIQETHMETPPTLPGYRTHSAPPSARDCGKGEAQGVCMYVRKGLTFVPREGLLARSTIEYCATEVVTGRKRKETLLLVNVYSNLTHRQQRFRALLHKAVREAQGGTVAVCGDFNAPHKELGYTRTTFKGRCLLEDAAEAGFALHMDPADPTRVGTSVSRDSNPDLTFVRQSPSARAGATWRNTGHNLGSDHFILELDLPTSVPAGGEAKRKHKFTDWSKFREGLREPKKEVDDIEQWTAAIVRAAEEATSEVETDEETQSADCRLAHLIEARQSLQRRWRRQRHNRKLRKRIAMLGREIEKYSRELCAQQWHAACSEADGQLHRGRTWALLRHLLDETKARGYQRHRLAQTMHTTVKELGEEETRKRLNERYLPQSPEEVFPEYCGKKNPWLDREIEVGKVRATLQTLNCKSAAGPDKITNKALKNLSDEVLVALTAYYNKCWRRGPGARDQQPVAAVLGRGGPYPNTMLGFRERLSTQDAMLLLQHDILDTSIPTQGNKAVLGLDLQSAFDKVRHSAILRQVSNLNIGKRTYEYIRDFLTGRTVEIQAGDLCLDPKRLGSEALQTAVYAIEDYLTDTGLRCSPQKSELLLVPPPGRYRNKGEEDSRVITVRTRDGTVIPRVTTLRVLGMYLEASRCNGTSADRIVTKLGIATRLIKRLAPKHSGMKEASLLRLIQSFAMSHVAYTVAFHPWKRPERDKINAAISKTYKTALGLLASTSPERLLELGLHNTLVLRRSARPRGRRNSNVCQRRWRGGRSSRELATTYEKSRSHRRRRGCRNRCSLRILPLPRNIHPDHNRGRREARARALTETHANDTGALYVDAAQYPDRKDTYVALLTGAGCTTILSDSLTAITNFLKDSVCASAVRMLQCSAGSSAPKTVTTVRWFPAHAGAGASGSGFPNRNETADAVARELTGRAAPPRDSQAA